MRAYKELSKEEKRKAIVIALSQVIKDVCEGTICFFGKDDDNSNDVQKLIDDALDEATSLETPWCAFEMVYVIAKDEIDEIAQKLAEETVYLEDGEYAVTLGGPFTKVDYPHDSQKSENRRTSN